MTAAIETPTVDEVRPVTKCGVCEQSDDHPKHQIGMAPFTTPDGIVLHHPHDFEKTGCLYYHFDCDTDWHQQATVSAPDHAKIVALAKSGVHGSDLHTAITTGAI